MSEIGMWMLIGGAALFAIAMFFSLCEPTNKMLPKAVAVGYVIALIGIILTGELRL